MAKPKSGGKERDDAVAWYCHMRLKKMLDEGAKQNELADRGHIPPSAINHLLHNGGGVGLTTVRGFAKLCGFETRGQLIDAADRWYGSSEGSRYAMREQRAMSEAKLKKTEEKLQRERIARQKLESAASER